MKKNVIVELSLTFSLNILEYVEVLKKERKYEVARQLIKSATSIGANVSEAQNSESKNDFIHKMKIAAKEASESNYWLTLCKKSPLYPDPGDLIGDLVIIQKILSKIISTSKKLAS